MHCENQTQELRVEIQQLKAKNHGLNTQIDALAVDHERLAGLLSTAEKVRALFLFCCGFVLMVSGRLTIVEVTIEKIMDSTSTTVQCRSPSTASAAASLLWELHVQASAHDVSRLLINYLANALKKA